MGSQLQVSASRSQQQQVRSGRSSACNAFRPDFWLLGVAVLPSATKHTVHTLLGCTTIALNSRYNKGAPPAPPPPRTADTRAGDGNLPLASPNSTCTHFISQQVYCSPPPPPWDMRSHSLCKCVCIGNSSVHVGRQDYRHMGSAYTDCGMRID